MDMASFDHRLLKPVITTLFLLLSSLCAHGQIWVRTMDGRTSAATEAGRMNGQKVRLKGIAGTPESGVSVPVTFIEEIQLPDGCRMVFDGTPLTLAGIRDLRFLSHHGSYLYAEDLYKLSSSEVHSLFGEEKYLAYRKNKALMNVGEASMALGFAAGVVYCSFLAIIKLAPEQILFNRYREEYGYPVSEPIDKGRMASVLWGGVALFTGGLALTLVGNHGLKHLKDNYNLGISENGAGLVFEF